MDTLAKDMMRWFVEDVLLPEKESKPLTILDVGAIDLNGGNRDLFQHPNWAYTGLDLQEGPNVDVVAKRPYRYPFSSNCFDVVISNQCAEHVEDLYSWADELIRILKPGGWLCIVAPTMWQEHRYPIDCWRIYPDGYRWLFIKRTGGKMQERNIEALQTQGMAIMKKVEVGV